MSEECEEEDNQEIKEQKFKNYSKDSNEITLYYELEKYFSEYKQWRDARLYTYAEQFSSIIKKNFCGYETFNKSDTLYQIKKKVSEKTGFPIETIIRFGFYDGDEYDPNGKLWNIISDYNVDDNTTIMNSRYNSSKVDDRKVYLYIDPSRSKIFESINENQVINDKKQKIMENDILNLKNDNKEKNKIIIDLKKENEIHKHQISDLNKKNETLRKKQEEQEKNKKQQERNIIDCENKFNENTVKFRINKIIDK